MILSQQEGKDVKTTPETARELQEPVATGLVIGNSSGLLPGRKVTLKKKYEGADFFQAVDKLQKEENRLQDDILEDIMSGKRNVEAKFTEEDKKLLISRCVMMSRVVQGQRKTVESLKKTLVDQHNVGQAITSIEAKAGEDIGGEIGARLPTVPNADELAEDLNAADDKILEAAQESLKAHDTDELKRFAGSIKEGRAGAALFDETLAYGFSISLLSQGYDVRVSVSDDIKHTFVVNGMCHIISKLRSVCVDAESRADRKLQFYSYKA